MPPTESRALGCWLVRLGVTALVVTAFAQAALPELGYLVFKAAGTGSYTPSEFAWEDAWLPYVAGAATLIAGIVLVTNERGA